MLAHPLEAGDLVGMQPADWRAEWKWDGIRVQLVATEGGRRLYSRGAEDISGAFPEIIEAMDFHAVLDGELLVVRDGQAAPFAHLQQRLNRKVVSAAHNGGVSRRVSGCTICCSRRPRTCVRSRSMYGERGWRRGTRERARHGWIYRN